jgi:hypothetical protein
MANQISGRVIALSQVKEVASSDPSKGAIKKRELYIDCTRYDPYTGERSQFENKPLLEFGGDKVLAKLESLNIKANDIVKVSFDIQGTPYKDKNTGKMRVYTAIRCYDIEVSRRADGSVPQQAQQPAPQPQPQPAPAPAPQPLNDPLPEPANDGLPF